MTAKANSVIAAIEAVVMVVSAIVVQPQQQWQQYSSSMHSSSYYYLHIHGKHVRCRPHHRPCTNPFHLAIPNLIEWEGTFVFKGDLVGWCILILLSPLKSIGWTLHLFVFKIRLSTSKDVNHRRHGRSRFIAHFEGVLLLKTKWVKKSKTKSKRQIKSMAAKKRAAKKCTNRKNMM